MWAAIDLIGFYLIVLVVLANGKSVAAREPRHFWWALLAWPILLPADWLNRALNKL